MSIGVYSFYLESEAGVPAPNMNPEITLMKVVPDGINLPEDILESTNLFLKDAGDGVYVFFFDWATWETNIATPGTPYVDLNAHDASIKRALFIKINTGLETQDQRYLTMRVERHDVLPELVDDLQNSADSLSTSAALLEVTTSKILAIEEGSWVVDGTSLLIFDKATVHENRNIENAIAKFDLFDQQGEATSTNPYSRIAKD